MDPLHAALASAIVTLVGAIGFLYRDKGKVEARLVSATAQHAATIKDLNDGFAKSLKEQSEAASRALRELGERFDKSVKEMSDDHKKQEDEIHDRNQRGMDELVREHKREMGSMVDRAIEAFRNGKEHDQALLERVLNVVDSLDRKAEAKRRT